MQATSPCIPVGDIQVACTVVAEGAPLIVVHGAIGLGTRYMRGLDRWADEFQLVYYDQRGSGGTPLGDPERVSFAGAIQDLDGLRAALGIDRANLVGHSAGAILAGLYAGTHPESTGSVVLLAPGPPLIPELMQAFGQEMASRRTPEDNAARKAIEESSLFHTRDPKTLERHQLNTFIPFFRDRATMEHVDMGFTEITRPTCKPRRSARSVAWAPSIRWRPWAASSAPRSWSMQRWTRCPSSGPTRWSTPSPARTSSSSKAPATFPTSRTATSWPALFCHGWPSTPCEPDSRRRCPTILPPRAEGPDD